MALRPSPVSTLLFHTCAATGSSPSSISLVWGGGFSGRDDEFFNIISESLYLLQFFSWSFTLSIRLFSFLPHQPLHHQSMILHQQLILILTNTPHLLNCHKHQVSQCACVHIPVGVYSAASVWCLTHTVPEQATCSVCVAERAAKQQDAEQVPRQLPPATAPSESVYVWREPV